MKKTIILLILLIICCLSSISCSPVILCDDFCCMNHKGECISDYSGRACWEGDPIIEGKVTKVNYTCSCKNSICQKEFL